MKKQLILLFAVLMSVSVWAQSLSPVYLEYIEKWKATAIQNQADYGIPASIIMAQALLESGAGQSELAQKANNHFGIKCTNDWLGATYRYSDERRNDCFRQYRNAAESYRDHALFLKRPRYETCFEIAIEDYEGWAKRLKECGYATDERYAPKLVKLIEDYHLDELTKEKVAKSQASQPKRPLKAEVVRRSEPIMVIHNDPEPPYVAPLTAKEERDSFFIQHPKHRQNGVVYVKAREEDTYASIAFRLNVRERDLREDNDALGRDLMPGDRIYLSPKKTKGVKDYVMTHPGLSLWKLCQDEAVMMETIQKLNELDPTIRTFRTRQKLYLKKVKDDGMR